MCILNQKHNFARTENWSDDFQNKKYAIITDESTDISTEKHFDFYVIGARKL